MSAKVAWQQKFDKTVSDIHFNGTPCSKIYRNFQCQRVSVIFEFTFTVILVTQRYEAKSFVSGNKILIRFFKISMQYAWSSETAKADLNYYLNKLLSSTKFVSSQLLNNAQISFTTGYLSIEYSIVVYILTLLTLFLFDKDVRIFHP